MAEVTITAMKDGPYQVKGKPELVDPTGAKVPVERDTIYLCRCGASDDKPFCDGTHNKIDFEAS